MTLSSRSKYNIEILRSRMSFLAKTIYADIKEKIDRFNYKLKTVVKDTVNYKTMGKIFAASIIVLFP